ncbi:MAG: hypothetical protein ACI4HQ_13655 [Acetatifactor sp.]
MWNNIVTLFREYMGTGLIVVLYLLCLVYMYLKEEKKYIRILFVCVPVCLLLLYFNPLFAEVVYRAAGDEIYYRILWLLPVTAGIAYTVCHICARIKGKKQLTFLAAIAVILVFSGKFIYDSPFFVKAENKYHVPDSVVHICDSIVVPGREVMAVFPRELLQYVRQYSAYVCMPYGREVLVERWNTYNELATAMERSVVNLEELVPLASEARCHYIILDENKEILGNPQDFGLEVFGQTDGYIIYRNTAETLEIDF